MYQVVDFRDVELLNPKEFDAMSEKMSRINWKDFKISGTYPNALGLIKQN